MFRFDILCGAHAREASAQARVVDRLCSGHLADHRQQDGLELVEDDLDLVGLHPGLVVVEHHVVGVAVVLEALDVASPQLEIPLEMREHDSVVLLLAGTQPGLVAERAGARQLGTQVGRHPDGLLEVTAGDADEARLERLLVVLGFERPELVEEGAEVV